MHLWSAQATRRTRQRKRANFLALLASRRPAHEPVERQGPHLVEHSPKERPDVLGAPGPVHGGRVGAEVSDEEQRGLEPARPLLMAARFVPCLPVKALMTLDLSCQAARAAGLALPGYAPQAIATRRGEVPPLDTHAALVEILGDLRE